MSRHLHLQSSNSNTIDSSSTRLALTSASSSSSSSAHDADADDPDPLSTQFRNEILQSTSCNSPCVKAYFSISPLTLRPWHRISRVLVLCAALQCLTSIYVWIDLSTHSFFFGYLFYGMIAFACMVLRMPMGLLWFGLGSLLYSIWLSLDTWHAVVSRDWVPMCFDFTFAGFELLLFCLCLSRFHEIGGFSSCCGKPKVGHRFMIGEDGVDEHVLERESAAAESEIQATMEPISAAPQRRNSYETMNTSTWNHPQQQHAAPLLAHDHQQIRTQLRGVTVDKSPPTSQSLHYSPSDSPPPSSSAESYSSYRPPTGRTIPSVSQGGVQRREFLAAVDFAASSHITSASQSLMEAGPFSAGASSTSSSYERQLGTGELIQRQQDSP